MADLDSILSGQGAVAPEAPEIQQEEPQTEAEQVTAEAVTEEAPEAEGDEAGQGQKMVPQKALHAEKQKVKRYTEQVASFEKMLADQAEAMRRLEAKFAEQAKPKEPEKPAPQFWDDPDVYLEHRISPVQQKIERELAETRFVLSRNVAVTAYGEEVVNEAEQALDAALKSGQMDVDSVRRQLEQSRDPVGDVVRWHKNSPAVKEQELREKVRAEILAEMQGNQQQGEMTRPNDVVLPSNLAGARNVGSRSGPTWSGPPPLNDIFDRARKH